MVMRIQQRTVLIDITECVREFSAELLPLLDHSDETVSIASAIANMVVKDLVCPTTSFNEGGTEEAEQYLESLCVNRHDAVQLLRFLEARLLQKVFATIPDLNNESVYHNVTCTVHPGNLLAIGFDHGPFQEGRGRH